MYHELTRRLNDDTAIRTADSGVPGWSLVTISAASGHLMFQGMLRTEELATEVAFQLDRAREWDKLWEAEKVSKVARGEI